MRAQRIVVGLGVIAIALMLVGIGYAYSDTARTYNTGNQNDVRFITVALGESQYSSAVTSEMAYHTDILIGANGRTVMYVPDHDDTITIEDEEIAVTEVVQFDIAVSKQSADPMPAYSLTVGVDDTSKMHGYFYVSYWTDPDDDGSRRNAAFPGSITIDGLTTQSIKFCLYVHADRSTTEPADPLEDIAFKFRTTAEV